MKSSAPAVCGAQKGCGGGRDHGPRIRENGGFREGSHLSRQAQKIEGKESPLEDHFGIINLEKLFVRDRK